MKMTKKDYQRYVDRKTPNSPMGGNLLRAFLSGGVICTIGQAIMNWFELRWAVEDASAATSITLVFLGALLTGIGVYDRLAKFSGAGTLVPITGFSNSVVSPALEFKSEGFVTGMAVKMFTIAGPVLVFGATASVVYGVIYWLVTAA